MRDQTEQEAIAAAETWLRVPDEPTTAPETVRCDQCGSSDVRYDERIHETFVYCLDCGAIL